MGILFFVIFLAISLPSTATSVFPYSLSMNTSLDKFSNFSVSAIQIPFNSCSTIISFS